MKKKTIHHLEITQYNSKKYTPVINDYIVIHCGKIAGVIRNCVFGKIYGKEYVPNWKENGLFIANIKVIKQNSYILIYEESILKVNNYAEGYITLPKEFTPFFTKQLETCEIIRLGNLDVIFLKKDPKLILKKMEEKFKTNREVFDAKKKEIFIKLWKEKDIALIKNQLNNNVGYTLRYSHIKAPSGTSRNQFITRIKKGKTFLDTDWTKNYPDCLNTEGKIVIENIKLENKARALHSEKWRKINFQFTYKFKVINYGDIWDIYYNL